jgi:hypothetical protein
MRLCLLRPCLVLSLLLGLGATAGCLGSESTGSDSLDDTESVASIALGNHWVLKSDGLTQGAASLHATIGLPGRYQYAVVGVDQGPTEVLTRSADGSFVVDLPVAELAPGEHRVVVTSKSSGKALGSAAFDVSAPLYVVVSADWDDSRFDDSYLARIEGLRAAHPGMKVTQFFGPYHYTDPELTDARKQQLETWVKAQRDDFGDEIGVHIHGWCHFIDTTSVPCRTAETFYQDDGSGYTTIVAAYSEAEMKVILQASLDMFELHGLGRPTAFRAGGWTADVKTMRALASMGFVVESSAVPAYRLADWKGYELYDWTMAHWQGITETSQPYYPLESNVAEADPAKGLPLLEVPDNGVLVDYMTGLDMQQVYEQNHPNAGPLDQPTVYQVGFHPPSFSPEFMTYLDQALAEVDQHRFDRDAGPALYVTLSELTAVWAP